MRKKKRGFPPISTSALPDIVFMLLFFFMVSTVLKKREVDLQIVLPEAQQIVKLQDPSLVNYIYIGEKARSTDGKIYIQLNDQMVSLDQVGPIMEQLVQRQLPQKRSRMITALKVHENTRMQIVTKVKKELRKVGCLKINYNTIKASG